MDTKVIQEARRQAEICNACRYCEGYCAVFPAMFAERVFSEGNIAQLANLCHNCRGCYYACQYTEPHVFALNLPAALADARQASWQEFAWPRAFARLFDRAGVAIALALALCLALLFWLVSAFAPADGAGFYAHMAHNLMVAIFTPAFLLPLLAIAISLRRYWRFVGAGKFSLSAFGRACSDAASMRNLKGGHGEGCNFEAEDKFSHARRVCHQMAFWGFLLCFASTSSGTVMHYFFDWQAPYAWYTLPKLLGVPGGVVLCLGSAGLAWLKLKADPKLGATRAWGGEMAFVLLLFWVSASGLLLYAATGTSAISWLLPLHLGSVLAFFLITPYSKMVHGFHRLAALTVDQQRRFSIC